VLLYPLLACAPLGGMMQQRWLICASVIAAMVAGVPAVADPHVFYTIADFASANPTTALEMVQRVPGFTLQNGGDARGLAGSRGNVLFDGAHLNSKSDSIWDTLNRMPSGRVARLELIREARPGIDMAGWPVVLNVVLKTEAQHQMQARVVNMNWLDGKPTIQGKLTGSGAAGRTAFEWNAGFYPEHFGPKGGMTTTSPDGTITGQRVDDVDSLFERSELSGAITRKLDAGSVRLSANAYHNNYQEHVDYHQSLVTGDVQTPDGVDYSDISDRTTGGEIGLEGERRFGASTAKLSLLGRRWRTVYDERFDDNDAGGRVGGSDDHARDLWDERVARFSVHRALGPHAVEAGVELVGNTLDAHEIYFEDTGSGLQPVDLTAGDVRVEEARRELFIEDAWTVRPGFMIETALRHEQSDIETTGDVNVANSFAFFKPRVQLSWVLPSKDQLRIEVRRDVSQLDFKDFAASSKATDGGVTAGNPDIAPTQSWVATLGVEHSFGGKGTLSASVFHHWIKDALDYIATEEGGDTRGNIDSAHMNGAKLALNMPLARILPGAEMLIEGTWQRYRLADPFTGRIRGLSNTPEAELHLRLRQDVAKYRFSWQFDSNWSSEQAEYRSTYIRRQRNEPWTDLFVEKKLSNGTALKAGFANLFGQDSRRRREFYTADRGTGVLDQLDERHRSDGRLLYFRVLAPL